MASKCIRQLSEGKIHVHGTYSHIDTVYKCSIFLREQSTYRADIRLPAQRPPHLTNKRNVHWWPLRRLVDPSYRVIACYRVIIAEDSDTCDDISTSGHPPNSVFPCTVTCQLLRDNTVYVDCPLKVHIDNIELKRGVVLGINTDKTLDTKIGIWWSTGSW